MTNSTNNICGDTSMDYQEFEEVTSFKYLDVTLCKDGICRAEVCMRIASAMTTMVRVNRIWWCNTISFTSKLKLYMPLVTSVLLYGCETWLVS